MKEGHSPLIQLILLPVMWSLYFFSALVCVVVGQRSGGMAELKSITGDAPYEGVGNAPAFVPRPMGFWGRPRYYSPMSYGGGPYSSFMGGYSPYAYDRFGSVSGTPYGLGTWQSGM